MSIVFLLLPVSLAELFPVVIVSATVPFLSPFLFKAVQFIVALFEKCTEFPGDDERVNTAVELAVPILLEAIEVQHHFRDLEIATHICHDACRLFEYASGQLLLDSAVFRQARQLRYQPHDREVLAVGGQTPDGWVVAQIAFLLPVVHAVEVAGIEPLQELVTIAVLVRQRHLLPQGET